MRDDEVGDAVVRDGWFVRAAGAVGDLGSPFYREERQRDVWNEASAIGFQLMLWLLLAAVTAMVWLGGAPALPYAMSVFAVLGVASWVSILYAHARGVDLGDAGRVLRLRMVVWGVLLVGFVAGLARVAPSDGFSGGFAQGAVLGAAGTVVWLAWSGLRLRRQAQRGAV